MALYHFPNHAEFLDREAELARLERWWDDKADQFPLVLYGRRRTGKSWLLRRFAHGKDADIFVCDTRAEGDQLAYFASGLQASLGVRPELPDVRALYDALLRPVAGRARRLVVIDEFPFLLQASHGAGSSLAAAMEEAGVDPRVKMVLCGSQISTMEGLLAERAALHGRATRLVMAPMPWTQAQRFLAPLRAGQAIARYAIAGGMPLYLRRLGRKGGLKDILCEDVLSPLGPFFDEVRELLAMELTSTAIYFSLLAALSSSRSLSWEELVGRSRVDAATASKYVRTLEDLRIVESANPVFSAVNARRRRYRVADPFVRFWFRFVFPYQADLMAGLRPQDHFDHNVAPALPGHAAGVYEGICQSWVRERFRASAGTVGSWWGLARHDLRRAGTRSSEEIDVVGGRGSVATVIGECRWQAQAMGLRVLDDLLEYKIPALAQAGVDPQAARIVLFSKSGFRQDLVSEAARRGDVDLVGLDELAGGLGLPGSR